MAYDKNVFILGAGASVEAGAPVFKNFLSRSRELLDNQQSSLTPSERDAFRRVFDWRARIYPSLRFIKINLENIEDLFSLIDMGVLLGIEDAEEVRDDLVRLISRTIELTVQYRHRRLVDGKGDRSVIPVHTAYEPFAQLFKDRSSNLAAGEPDCIITLNYDTVIDYALTCYEVEFTYGCPWMEDSGSDKHRLIKLHGSANWGFCPKCYRNMVEMDFFGRVKDEQFKKAVASDQSGEIDQINMAPATMIYSTKCPSCEKANFEPFIVPPTWNKVSYNEDMLKHVWRSAREELAQATRLFIIGYSLPRTDNFFKYLLTLGLSENDSLQKIVLIDPAKGDAGELLEKRYLDFIAPFFDVDNFTFWNMAFSAGAKALEYKRGDPGMSDEEALDRAVYFVEQNRISRIGYTRPANLALGEPFK